ncbi:hypothetical protein AB0J83_11960 [Actinoplanes sp. NPDC049596]|uniref:WD40 repeat domain-containing protein n=1 Tax=unclassified Actinoplanes TaxID=2626549 RepID=UPI003434F244
MKASPYEAMAFRSDARRLAVSAPNGELIVWDTTDPVAPARAGRLRQGRGIVAAAWNPATADILATTSSDGTAAVWWLPENGRQSSRVAHWMALPARPRHVGWVGGGRWVFSMAGRGLTSVWDVNTGARVGQADVTGGRLVVAAHHLGEEVVAVTDSGWARIWHPRRAPGEWIQVSAGPVSACAWSGTLLAVGGTDGRVACVNAAFEHVCDFRIGPRRPGALAFSDEGRLVASSADGTAIAVDLDGSVQWQAWLAADAARPIDVAGGLVAVSTTRTRPALLALADGANLN